MKINIDHWKQLLFAPNFKKKSTFFLKLDNISVTLKCNR